MELDEIAKKQVKEIPIEYSADSPQKKSDIKNYIIVALATALIVVGLVWIRDSWTSPASLAPTGGIIAPPSPAQPPPAAPPVDMKALVDDDPALGDKNAPVTIIEFSDFQCPFCGQFFTQTLPQIKTNYIDAGKVRFVYRDFPLDSIHAQATPAAIAANCAGEQGKFWEFHDLIFQNQQSLSSASYKQWVGELGLDVQQWEACTKDPKQLQEVRKDLADGSAVGVQGTPAFFINGRMVIGAQPYSVFEQLIEGFLADD